MITLTPRAAAQIRHLRTGLDDPRNQLRLFIEPGGCSGLQYGMAFAPIRPGDREFLSEGEVVLVDPDSLAQLQGAEVDFDDGLHGQGFAIRNPNARSTCGCGKSFT